MTTAVDSAVLIDVFQEEPGWAARSADALDAASRAGRLAVCDVVWAEVAGRFAPPAAAAEIGSWPISWSARMRCTRRRPCSPAIAASIDAISNGCASSSQAD